jgi:hypothetical protein
MYALHSLVGFSAVVVPEDYIGGAATVATLKCRRHRLQVVFYHGIIRADCSQTLCFPGTILASAHAVVLMRAGGQTSIGRFKNARIDMPV